MNPPGIFSSGTRQREYSTVADPLPISGKLIPEFSGRRNIRDMFARKLSVQQSQEVLSTSTKLVDCSVNKITDTTGEENTFASSEIHSVRKMQSIIPKKSLMATYKRRTPDEASTSKVPKRLKPSTAAAAVTPPSIGKSQQSLKGFLRPIVALPIDSTGIDTGAKLTKATTLEKYRGSGLQLPTQEIFANTQSPLDTVGPESSTDQTPNINKTEYDTDRNQPTPSFEDAKAHDSVHDPIETKESWSKLFTKPVAPRCEGHNEPCITLLTKKPGINLGRSFWMCRRPLGPSGAKEKNTQWRCQTFIWCSDWNQNAASDK